MGLILFLNGRCDNVPDLTRKGHFDLTSPERDILTPLLRRGKGDRQVRSTVEAGEERKSNSGVSRFVHLISLG